MSLKVHNYVIKVTLNFLELACDYTCMCEALVLGLAVKATTEVRSDK